MRHRLRRSSALLATFNRLSGRPLEIGYFFRHKEVCGRSGLPGVSLSKFFLIWAMPRRYPRTEKRWLSGEKKIPYGFLLRRGHLHGSIFLLHSHRNSKEFRFTCDSRQTGKESDYQVGSGWGPNYGHWSGRTGQGRNPAGSLQIIPSLGPHLSIGSPIPGTW